ncbi:MAG: alpha-glucuronidase family glycosyl hydrolase [Rhizomicrobium sp.]
MRNLPDLVLCLLLLIPISPAFGEDGYDLWLRYPTMAKAEAAHYPIRQITPLNHSPSLDAAVAELQRALSGMLGRPVKTAHDLHDGALLIGRSDAPELAGLHLDQNTIGPEGFIIRTVRLKGYAVTVIAGGSDIGALYGAFRYLRLVQTRQPVDHLTLSDAPKIHNRILDHWDNLDRTVERGYAGFSIWDWPKLPDYADPRYTDYARANASVGINGVVLNNVNAQAEILDADYLGKVAALAKIFRPYGIRVYLTARFSAPIHLGGLKTADPADPTVKAWWQAKTDEIYRHIPDFGGFLIKANSEGEPGPQDYGQSHADGANMLADALAPHGGIVMWRAFVYASDPKVDRVMQAAREFTPLDGQFRDNVVIQIKNGPLDFQPREPFSPLFGSMPKTHLGLELQITKEYLGFATHLVYLGPLFEEALHADTETRGPASTIAKIISGPHSTIAGVANIGTDRDWCGSIFNQANWYAFGRLAWNPDMTSDAIATEWAAETFTPDPHFVAPVRTMMMTSREAAVDYMTPLGLAHLMGTGHHYGPAPWVDDAGRSDWNPVYYHRADANGIGVDRTPTGSNAVAQYAPTVAARFADRHQIDEKYLLWFHHVGWNEKLRSGRTVWAELVFQYDKGVQQVTAMNQSWATMQPFVDPERFTKTRAFLTIQASEAQWWRDASIAYFQSVSQRPLPAGVAKPAHALEYYKKLNFPYAPGTLR